MAPIAAPRPSVMAERNVLRDASCSPIGRARDLLAGRRRSGSCRRRPALAHDVVDPPDAEEHHDHGADGDDPPAHEQADEREGDSDGYADRPDACCRRVTVLGLVQRSSGLRVACSSIQSCRISPVNVVAVASRPYSASGCRQGLDLSRHLDLLRPRPRVLLGQLVRRVDAELAAVELPPGRVVEVVERPFGDEHVALRIDVRRHAEEHVLVVVDVHVLVDDDDRLREREHPQAPERVHYLLRVAGERLADRDDDAVVERPRDGQVVVDDLGQRHPDGGQEDPLGRLAEPCVLGRRLADDDRG